MIAVFYSDGIDTAPLLIAGGTFASMLVMNKVKIYARAPYLIFGVVLWFFVHDSGLHATLAGVLTAAAIPLQTHRQYRWRSGTDIRPVRSRTGQGKDAAGNGVFRVFASTATGARSSSRAGLSPSAGS